jgi:CubicO group peptidase (beta-lactamase class C family)
LATPESQGIDSAALAKLTRSFADRKLEVFSFTITRNGHMVYELYANGLSSKSNFYIMSCTKSITSTLVGIAIEKGRIKDENQKVIDILPERYGRMKEAQNKKDVTLRDVLAMQSGIKYSYPSDYAGPLPEGETRFINAPDRTRYSLSLPITGMPGRAFSYSNVDSQLAGATVHFASGKGSLKFAEEQLFRPLGFQRYSWEFADQTGVYPGGWGIRLRARDMAKFGQLYLQRGQWNGHQLVPEEWVIRAALTDQTKTGYGYQWWMFPIDKEFAYTAIGLYGQYITVVPGHNLVVTMTGRWPQSSQDDLWKRTLRMFVLPAIKSGGSLPESEQVSKELRNALSEHAARPTSWQKVEVWWRPRS